MATTPKLPRRATDGQRVMDNSGNVYVYNAFEKAWINTGTIRAPDSVTEDNDGLVTPEIFDRIMSLVAATNDARSLPLELKLLPHTQAIWYLFRSSDKLIKFLPESSNVLRIEVDRARLFAAAALRACRGPKGPKGLKGPRGLSGGPPTTEVCFAGQLSQDLKELSFNLLVEAPLGGADATPISLRLATGPDIDPNVTILVDTVDQSKLPVISGPIVGMSLDQTRTLRSIKYNPDTQKLTGTFFLAAGNFPGLCILARQKGKVGDRGDPGRCFLTVKECMTAYEGVKFTNPIIGIRRGCDNQLFTITSNLFAKVCVSRLRPDLVAPGFDQLAPGPMTANKAQLLAVRKTLDTCKDLSVFKISPAGNGNITDSLLTNPNKPDLQYPDWTPQDGCTTNSRTELSDFNWVPRTGSSEWEGPDGARESNYPWYIAVPTQSSNPGSCDPCADAGNIELPCPDGGFATSLIGQYNLIRAFGSECYKTDTGILLQRIDRTVWSGGGSTLTYAPSTSSPTGFLWTLYNSISDCTWVCSGINQTVDGSAGWNGSGDMILTPNSKFGPCSEPATVSASTEC